MPLSANSTSRMDLRAAAVAALLNRTDAGPHVFSPDSLPMNDDQFPAILVTAPSERKDTDGTGSPKFSSTISLAVMARVSGRNNLAVEAALDRLMGQIETVLLCRPEVTTIIQRFVFVETHSVVSAVSETFVGEATAIFGCEVWQHYLPDAGDPLTEIVTTIPAPGSDPGIKLDTHVGQPTS